MALIKGKQLQDTSVSLTKLSGATGSVTLTTGTITTPAANLVISSLPVSGSQAANKEYVDSVATGLDIKKSVVAVYRTYVAAAGGTPAITTNSQLDGVDADDGNVYTAITTQAVIGLLVLDGITITDGDRVLIAIQQTGARRKVNGIYVYQAGQLIRSEDADNVTANIGEVSGGLFTFVEQGTVYGDTGWVLSSPNGAISGQTGAAGLYDFTNNPAGLVELEFTQFSAAGVAEAGVGLTRTGTKFNVNYDDSSIGIDANDALYVKANGITNAMILNEFITFAGDSGSSNIALGGTLTIAGGTNGIDTAYSAGTLTINLDLSELSTVSTIADSDFIAGVTANGATNQKITFANLKTLIGAASQLSISAEGATASSLDLDTDTLDFATGQGLTFAATGGAAPGTTNTLTLTVSNNALNVHQATSYTTAASGNTDITITAAAEVFSVTVNGVMLKKTTNWVWPQGANTVVRVTGLPYALEASDEIEITYRVA
jgi:hypothetical protein